jgi:hypothetical protein
LVSEQLEESLRHEIESYVERRLGEFKQEIAQLQNQLNESLKQILEREGESQWDGSLAATIAEHLRAAHERGIELAAAESTRAQASSDMAIVKAAIDEIVGQQSQSEILKTLVNRASSFAPRTAFFVIKGEQALGWRARGFQGTVGDEAVQQITLPLLADTVVAAVVKSRATWSGNPDSHSEDHLLLHRLGEQAPVRIVAVPLVVRGRTVAVLYADSAGLDSEAINLEALETLARVAGMAVELLSVSLAAAARSQAEPEATPEPVAETIEAAPTYTPEREYEEAQAPEPAATTAVEEEQVTAEPVPLIADSESIQAAPSSAPTPEPAPTPELALTHEPTTLTPEPVLTPEPAAPPVARRRYGSHDTELPVEVHDDEERRQHNEARRFARLLVSEIKLYNEQRVVEGRSNGDLYERLREYIDRSREMYDKRVKTLVSAKYDYFHHELVRTLAEGDASKLGDAYPGTTVSA